MCSAEDWRRLAELLLEGDGMGGVYLANKSVLSMYGSGRTTGICVDSGEDMTYIVPCWEGTPLPNATLILKLGGKHVTGRSCTTNSIIILLLSFLYNSPIK